MRTDRETDRHEETNSSLSQFCERIQKRVNVLELIRYIQSGAEVT